MAKKSKSKRSSLFGKLCNPAQFYLVISFVAILLVSLQNLRTPGRLCLGSYSCTNNHVPQYLLGNAVYILFCTWILDLICKGSPKLSWVIVLIPFILMFLAFGLVVFTGIQKDLQKQ